MLDLREGRAGVESGDTGGEMSPSISSLLMRRGRLLESAQGTGDANRSGDKRRSIPQLVLRAGGARLESAEKLLELLKSDATDDPSSAEEAE
jgi:hypothetical protein